MTDDRNTPRSIDLPEPDEATEILRRCAVRPEHLARIVATHPSRHPDNAPSQRHWIDACASTLLDDMGGFDPLPPWPPVPAPDGSDEQRLLSVWTFVAALPHTLRYHADRGIPPDISWHTFTNLGDAIDRYARAHGEPALDVPWWLTLHFRGGLYRLGRLQFNLRRPGLGVHIPAGAPLEPEACDASFRHAARFFADHFPEHPVDTARCTSWLLDPRLADFLSADSNIVRFQRRFELTDDERDARDATDDIMRFVFGRSRPLDELPRRTTLERALVDHLCAGGRWLVRSGTLSLTDLAG